MNSNATVRSKVGSAPSPRAASRPGPAASGMTPGWFYLFGYKSLTLSPLVGWSRDLPQRKTLRVLGTRDDDAEQPPVLIVEEA
jgi:hypothetical protein